MSTTTETRLGAFSSFQIMQRSPHPGNVAVDVTFRGPITGAQQTVRFLPNQVEAMHTAIREAAHNA